MRSRWVGRNDVTLLENGEEFFPRVFEAIESATHEILIETFILHEDRIGAKLQQALRQAAQRGVRVELTVDAWGSRELSRAFVEAMDADGVCLHLFGLVPAWRLRIAWFRRLHRKLLVIDRERAFIGGINFGEEYEAGHEPDGMQDYAVEVVGPVVADVRDEMLAALRTVHPELPGRRHVPGPAGEMEAVFAARTNGRRRTLIERHYLHAIARARQRIVIANAYFFPGYRLLRALSRAAQRGVDVRLVLQGSPDVPLMQFASRLLYEQLHQARVRIFEYCTRPFHGKVAIVDDEWVTVGSSNLDPLSLALNLEANLIVRDRALNERVAERLGRLMQHDCDEVPNGASVRFSRWRPVGTTLAYHFLRHFPQWSGWLPAHEPELTTIRRGSAGAHGLDGK